MVLGMGAMRVSIREFFGFVSVDKASETLPEIHVYIYIAQYIYIYIIFNVRYMIYFLYSICDMILCMCACDMICVYTKVENIAGEGHAETLP